jgi:oxygen-dependent protoporphyrinogen oxidase
VAYRFLESAVLGMPLSQSKHYHIYGAGISGLMLAFYLKQNNISFTIYEKSDKAGGLLQSYKLNNGLAEAAANGFLWSDELAEITKVIGLKPISANKINNTKYFVVNKKLKRFPIAIHQLLATIIKTFTPKKIEADTLADFGNAYFGKYFTDNILSPGMSGVYAAYADELSFAAVLPLIAKKTTLSSWLPKALFKKTDNLSIPKSKNTHKGTHAFKMGMGELSKGLSDYLSDSIIYNYTATEKDLVDKDAIICLPAYQAADLFPNYQLQTILKKIKYNPVISITFIFNASASDKFKKGFGCLIPKAEDLNMLGILFNNYIFDDRVSNAEQISLTCIARSEALANGTDDNALAVILNELDLLFHLKEYPVETKIFKYPKGIPLYSPNLYNSWFFIQDILNSDFPRVRLFGNYTGQISIRGMAKEAKKVAFFIKD